MAESTTPRAAARTRIAVAGAGDVTRSLFAQTDRRERIASTVFVSVLMLLLSLAVLAVVSIIVWALVTGWPRLSWDLFTNGPSTLRVESAGYRTAILGTLQVIGGVIVLIVPLGVGAAVYLEEYADPSKWWNKLIELNIQNLAGVPSIVFGILGLAFIVRSPLNLGFVAAAGSLTVALLVLPTVILASREAIRAIPTSIREASLAVGATEWQTIRRQTLPAAIPGILTGVILAVARAIGEAAPLLLVGAVTFVRFNPSFFEGGYSVLPVMIYNYAGRPQEEFRTLAIAGVIVMLAILLVMNGLAIWLRNRYTKTW
jgi:phosphate transport system permease protein